MRKFFILAAACVTLCGCDLGNSNVSLSEAPAESATEAVTEAGTEAETEAPEAALAEMPVVSAGDFGQPDPWTQEGNIVFIGEDGSYYYDCETSWYDGPFHVWFRDDRAGNTAPLDIPAGIDETGYNYYDVLAMADGALWADCRNAGGSGTGLCSYRNGQAEDFPEPAGSAEIRGFSEEGICFINEGALWLADYSGKQAEVCVPDVGTADVSAVHIHEGAAFLDVGGDEPGVYSCELKTGQCRYISPGSTDLIAGDWLYFRQPEGLFRVSLEGMTVQRLTDRAVSHFCLCDGKLYYTTYQEDSPLYSLDGNGVTTAMLEGSGLPDCTGINRVSTADGRLFAEGFSGAFWYVIAEMQPDGSWSVIHQGEER